MALYAYLYINPQGEPHTGEVGAQNIHEAAEKVRLRIKGLQEFIVWDTEAPPNSIREWLEDVLGKY